jgi:hypothetical protein
MLVIKQENRYVFFAVRTQQLSVTYWLRRSVAVLSLHSPGFDPRRVHMIFLMDEVALGEVLPG